MRYFVEVVLPLAVPKNFTYEIHSDNFETITTGMRVAVPFGKNRIYTGLVLNKHTNLPLLYEAKPVEQILDEVSVVNPLQIKHWQWISSYYMCSLGEVLKSALPATYLLESETNLRFLEDFTKTDQLTDEEYLVYEALQLHSSISVKDLAKIINRKNYLPLMQRLIDIKMVVLFEEVLETYKPKEVTYIRLTQSKSEGLELNNLLEELSNAKKQKEAVLIYFQLLAQHKRPIKQKELTEKDITTSTINALIAKDIFQKYSLVEDRVNYNKKLGAAFELSEHQQQAFTEIKEKHNQKSVVLLHGITASGKTEVYMKLIEEHVGQGKQVLYLLPEIALTTQLVTRLTAYFGNSVSVFHSKFNNNERTEVWKNVLTNNSKAQLVIGVRSALFLPFSNLGLIVVDEEHEQTYKQQDPAPRYHARDAAVVLANLHKAKVLLGSATPSLESFYNVNKKKYELVSLTERYGKVHLPEIKLVDLKKAYFKKQMRGHFSELLLEEMTMAIAEKKQVIIFQNRRGFSSFIECIPCGHVPHCPSCDVSFTYYKYKNNLSCHYCGHTIAKPTNCHVCNSPELNTKGFGTEQIEEELRLLFPESTVARMDQDTTRGKYGFEKLIDRFKNQEIDILIGTQMLAKGLHFDAVKVVGVLNADNLLNLPYYKAYERAYQMLTQVAGRAGRKEQKGTVVIQTYSVEHSIINQVVGNKYYDMFMEQIPERKTFKYPPFYKVIKLTLKHKDCEKLKEASFWLYNVLKQQMNVPVLGPEEPAINRIRNQYIRNIMIKIPNENNLSASKVVISKILLSFDAIAQYRSVRVKIEVDY